MKAYYFFCCLVLLGCQTKIYTDSDFKCQTKSYSTGLATTFDPPRSVGGSYVNASFNKNSNHEIIVCKGTGRYKRLIKYNLKTKKQELLADSIHHFYSDWSNQNRVLYTKYILRKPMKYILINTTTKEKIVLEQLTGIFKTWTYDGNYLVDRSGQIISLQGDTITSVLIGQFTHAFEHKNRIACSKNDLMVIAGQKIGVIDMKTKELIYESDFKIHGAGVSWFPDNKRVVWSGILKGLNITNIKTGETIQLRKNCINRKYYAPSVSPNEKYIVCNREDINTQNNTVKKGICIMKTNGKDEKLIEFE